MEGERSGNSRISGVISGSGSAGNFAFLDSLGPDRIIDAFVFGTVTAGVYIVQRGFHMAVHKNAAVDLESHGGSQGGICPDACGYDHHLSREAGSISQFYAGQDVYKRQAWVHHI